MKGSCQYGLIRLALQGQRNLRLIGVWYTPRYDACLVFKSAFSPALFPRAAEPCRHQEWNAVLPQVAGDSCRGGDSETDTLSIWLIRPAAGFSVQAVIDRIAAKNVEAVVCDTSTPSILNDVSVIESLVAAKPSLHVLLVGRHVSALPRETLAMSGALEAVAVREYEYTVRDWLAAKSCGADLSTVDGLVWRASKWGDHQQCSAPCH